MHSKTILWWALAMGGIAVIALTLSLIFFESDGMMGGSMMGGSMMGSGGMMGDIERHFIEQMIPHHESAVAMADLALTRAEHAELRQLAEAIKRDQTQEIDQMRSWYRSWYGVDAPTDSTTSGGRSGGGMMGGGMMDGMMGDDADLEVLKAAPTFDKEFIQQMVPHHQMALMMARMVLGRAEHREMEDLARSIIDSQSAEIEQMQDWYRDWYEQ